MELERKWVGLVDVTRLGHGVESSSGTLLYKSTLIVEPTDFSPKRVHSLFK